MCSHPQQCLSFAQTQNPLELAWPEYLVRVPVETAINGLWLDEGEAVQLLWDAANRNPYHMPVVEEKGSRYRIILQVPGVSWIEPQ